MVMKLLDFFVEDAEQDVNAMGEATRMTREFQRWLLRNNEEVPFGKLSTRIRANGIVIWWVKAANIGLSEYPDLMLGFYHVDNNPARGLHLRFRQNNVPMQAALVAINDDIDNAVDLAYQMDHNVMVHELTHYLDFKRMSPSRLSVTKSEQAKNGSSYYNDPVETNAFFQQGIESFFRSYVSDRSELPWKSVDDFIRHARPHFRENWLDSLNPQRKRAFDKRMARLYTWLNDQSDPKLIMHRALNKGIDNISLEG